MKKIIILIVVILLLCSFSSCKKSEKDSDDNKASVAYYYDCECKIIEGSYDITNVGLEYTFGFRLKGIERDYFLSSVENNLEYQTISNELYNNPDLDYDYPPVKIYLYFSSFGQQVLIKTIDDFFSEEYYQKHHSEVIVVPQELFSNEYGRIIFSMTDEEGGNVITKLKGETNRSCFFYKKVGDKIQVSKKDLKPQYKSYYQELKNQGFFQEDGVCGGFKTKQDKSDYCALYMKADQYSDAAVVEVFYGSLFNDRNIEYVDLYFINDDEPEKRVFIKRINNYSQEEYAVIVDRDYDYDGNAIILGVRFNHHETINISQDLFTQKRGKVYFSMSFKEYGKEETECIKLRNISYFHCFDDYNDDRPYNRMNLSINDRDI